MKQHADNWKIENVLKGQMAVTVVSELLKRSGNLVYHYGYGYLLQDLVQFDRKLTGSAGEIVRFMPDLLIVNPEGETTLAEVKFREFYLNDPDKENFSSLGKRWRHIGIIVRRDKQPYFWIYHPTDEQHEEKWKELLMTELFKIDWEIYLECEELIEKYFHSQREIV